MLQHCTYFNSFRCITDCEERRPSSAEAVVALKELWAACAGKERSKKAADIRRATGPSRIANQYRLSANVAEIGRRSSPVRDGISERKCPYEKVEQMLSKQRRALQRLDNSPHRRTLPKNDSKSDKLDVTRPQRRSTEPTREGPLQHSINELNTDNTSWSSDSSNELFHFTLVGEVLTSDNHDKNRIPGGTFNEIWANVQPNLSCIVEHIAEWFSRLHISRNSSLSITLHTITLGRMRQTFSDQLRYRLPQQWFTCISRKHFCISITLVGSFVSIKTRFNNEVVDPVFDIDFEIKCLSANGAGLNQLPLRSSDAQRLKSGDLIHLFNPSTCQQSDSTIAPLDSCIAGLLFHPRQSITRRLKDSIFKSFHSRMT